MSSKSLEDYEVLNVIQFGVFGTCFKVCDKTTGKLFVWKSVDYGSLSESKKQAFLNELKELSERWHPNVIHCMDYIIHLISDTVYVVMEWCPGGDLASLVDGCRKENGIYMNEDFLWKMLYQIGQAVYFCQLKSKDCSTLSESVTLSNVFLDVDGNAKLGDSDLSRILHLNNLMSDLLVESAFFNSPNSSKNQKVEPKSEMVALGCFIYKLATLDSTSSELDCLSGNDASNIDRLDLVSSVYSEDLHNILRFLLKKFEHQQPSMKTILHHPTVVKKIKTCLWNSKEFNKFFREKCSIDAANPKNYPDCREKHLVSLKNAPPSEKKLCSENVTEKTFQEKWLNRIELIRKKEAELKMKEEQLNEKERLVSKKEKQVVILEKLAKEKIKRAEVYLRQCKEFRVKPKVKTCVISRPTPDYNFDSSFSADPGDTSILPTTAKIIEFGQILDSNNFKEIKPKERHVSFDKPLPKRLPELKVSSENKENSIPTRVSFHDLMTNQNVHGLKNTVNRTSNLSGSGNIPGKGLNKTSTLSLKSDQPFKSEPLGRNFLPKSCSLKVLRKKVTCNKHTSL